MVGVVLQAPCEIVEVMLGNTEPFSWGYDVCLDLGGLAWNALFSPNYCYYWSFQTNFEQTRFLYTGALSMQTAKQLLYSHQPRQLSMCEESRSYMQVLWYLVDTLGIRLPGGIVQAVVNYLLLQSTSLSNLLGSLIDCSFIAILSAHFSHSALCSFLPTTPNLKEMVRL